MTTSTTLPPNRQREAARAYRARGWKPVPIPAGLKNPIEKKWQHQDFADSEFLRLGNIGVQFGNPSGGLLDVDLDCHEARELATYFMPETGAVFGRKTSPAAHWLYVSDMFENTSLAVTTFDDPEPPAGAEHGKVMIEIRSGAVDKSGTVKGAVSMFPPSRHPDGERLKWDRDGEPAEITADDLMQAVAHLAVATLLARHWPAKGKRQSAALVIGGTLARAGMAADTIEILVGNAARIAGDEEWRGRGPSAAGAVERLARDDSVPGFPRLQEMWSERFAKSVTDFLLHAGYRYNESSRDTGSDSADAEMFELPANAPIKWARAFINNQFMRDGANGLVHYRDGYYEWTGTHFELCDEGYLRSKVYAFFENKMVIGAKGASPFNPDQSKVNKTLDALSAITEERGKQEAPFWLDGRTAPAPANLIACGNGLLDYTTRKLYPHSPAYFNLNALPFDYDPDAPKYPKRWMAFLRQLWPGNDDGKRARCTLQEIFGLMLTPSTAQQKLFMVIGPTRSGKGTVGRVLKSLLGSTNVVNPTLSGLSGNFGMAVLIGKRVAIISDARIGGASSMSVVVERLLSISGEDDQSVDRKFKEHWTGRLQARMLFLTNELPALRDTSGAFAARFVLLCLTNSFLGKEDVELTDKLCAELPGILNWSLKGLERLRQRGRFKMPESSQQAMRQMQDLTSPVNGFVRDWCTTGSDHSVPKQQLFNAWRQWCEQEGHHPGSHTRFTRDLNAVLPQLTITHRGTRSQRQRHYCGIGLSTEGEQEFDRLWRASPHRRPE